MPSTYYVAWWNLENLFDEENSPRRTEKLQRAIGADLAGWTPALRDRKVAQLASVITQMSGGAGPDLLGVCEVENRFVLELLVAALGGPLPGRDYDIVHADTDDARGIDVAFIYDNDLFEAPAGEVFFHVVMCRNATRELVQVNFKTKQQDRTWSVFGNHLAVPQRRPVRLGRLPPHHRRDPWLLPPARPRSPRLRHPGVGDGRLQRRTVRHVAGHPRPQYPPTPACRRGRHRQVLEPDVVGDRRPARRDLLLQQRAQPAGPVPGQQEHGNQHSPIRAKADTVEILRFPGTFSTGKYPRPKPFGGMGKPVDEDGFPDHFPIGMQVTEAD